MTAAFTHARMVGARRVACASTGNTSAALAVYCSATDFGFKAIIFIGSGKIAYGKLAQALDHGALTIQIVGDFDDAMHRVRQVADRLGIYLMNSVNPFRLEGQKTIMYRVLEGLGWEPPDWIVVPGGNLGNSSAFGKAFIELKHLGLIDRVPRLAVINAAGARTLDAAGRPARPDLARRPARHGGRPRPTTTELDAEGLKASTIASAIEINRPVNLKKCLRALDFCDGVVRQVTDQEIMDAKARVGSGGLGCEPASAASVAGAKKLREEGVIAPSDSGRLHPDRPPAQGPDGDGRLPRHRPGELREGPGQPRRPPRRVRQPAGRGRQRPRRHHPDDRALLRRRAGRRSGEVTEETAESAGIDRPAPAPVTTRVVVDHQVHIPLGDVARDASRLLVVDVEDERGGGPQDAVGVVRGRPVGPCRTRTAFAHRSSGMSGRCGPGLLRGTP